MGAPPPTDGDSAARDLSPSEASRLMGVSRSLVYRLVERGELRAYRLSNRLRIPRSSVEELRERNLVKPERAPAYEPLMRSRTHLRNDTFASQLKAHRRSQAA